MASHIEVSTSYPSWRNTNLPFSHFLAVTAWHRKRICTPRGRRAQWWGDLALELNAACHNEKQHPVFTQCVSGLGLEPVDLGGTWLSETPARTAKIVLALLLPQLQVAQLAASKETLSFHWGEEREG